jgi:hypothetical protein
MPFIYFLFALFVSPAFAASTVVVQTAITAYSKPDFNAPVVFTVEAGSSILVSTKAYGGFRKIKTQVEGQSRLGYVTAGDLAQQSRPPKEKTWGLGGGFVYSKISQGEKSFTTEDQVKYVISDYAGTTTYPALSLQFGQKNFWRIHAAYKTVGLSGTARKADIPDAPPLAVEVEYTMAVFGAQMAWGLFSKVFYAGGGFDFAKTLSGKVKFGTQDLTDQAEYPDYLGVHVFSGAQVRLSSSLSLLGEARIGAITNQSPVLTVIEIGAALLFWP